MDQEVPLRAGDVLAGRYQLERQLGSGGMGLVYSAIHLDLGRRVAIKVLRAESRDLAESSARFLIEARATARLSGPHVAKVLDIGRMDERTPYLVMEYLEGSNLQQVIAEQGPQPVALSVDYLLDACEALAEAHRAGIVHRDLKPANLFLTRNVYGDAIIKVLDFGISKLLEPTEGDALGLTDSRALMGSPVYMSPEQMRSARDVDHRTDIWSLGALLFELLTGRPVWTGQSLSELCAQVSRDPAPDVRDACPDAPAALSQVIRRCLHKDVQLRYQQVTDLALALVPYASPRGQATLPRVLLLAGQKRAHELPTGAGQNGLRLIPQPSSDSTFIGTAATQSSASRRRLPVLLVSVALATSLALFFWLRPDSSKYQVHALASSSPSPALVPSLTAQPLTLRPTSSTVVAESPLVNASEVSVDSTNSVKRLKKVIAPTRRPSAPSPSPPKISDDPMSIRK